MSLTMGNGPFGHVPGGVFNRPIEREGLLFLDPSPRRVRGLLGGEVVVDSTRVSLLHEHAQLARYYFPEADVREGVLVPSGHTTMSPTKGRIVAFDLQVGDRHISNGAWCHRQLPEGAPPLRGLVAFYWRALDEWLEEDEPLLAHARDPYHRVDAMSSSRHVRVSLDGVVLAESDHPSVIFETGLVPRWYFAPGEVNAELEPSDLTTRCAYKGEARYWSVRTPSGVAENVAWSYPDPRRDAVPVRDAIAFYDEHVDIDVDGVRQERPQTPWAVPRWWEATAEFEANL